MSTYTFDPLTEPCAVCGHRVGVVSAWMPYGAGIRHATCEPEPCKVCEQAPCDCEPVTCWECGENPCDCEVA